MICTGYNAHITSLLMNQQILWKLKLASGTEIWSDFDVKDQEDPWTRAKQYCHDNDESIVALKIIIPGQPEVDALQNEDGLDKFFVMRGTAKDITDAEETVYGFITIGKLESDGLIHVKKFFWPECSFLESEEIREITPENEKLLYVKNKN